MWCFLLPIVTRYQPFCEKRPTAFADSSGLNFEICLFYFPFSARLSAHQFRKKRQHMHLETSSWLFRPKPKKNRTLSWRKADRIIGSSDLRRYLSPQGRRRYITWHIDTCIRHVSIYVDIWDTQLPYGSIGELCLAEQTDQSLVYGTHNFLMDLLVIYVLQSRQIDPWSISYAWPVW